MVAMKILISTSTFAEYSKKPLELLQSAGVELIINPYKRKLTALELVELAKDCEGILAGTEEYPETILDQLPKLKLISRCGAGLDSINLEAAKKRGIKIVSTPNAPTEAVAELTIAMILSLLRKIPQSGADVKKGKWKKQMGGLLKGRTIGIIGLGKIGRRVAVLLRSFEPNLLGFDIAPDNEWATKNKVNLETLDALLEQSDIVTLHIPTTADNHNFINSKRIMLMKKGVLFVNTARGELVDEDALFKTLESGHIGGAALDVLKNEPYSGPLTTLDNVLITPHIGSYAVESRVTMEMEAAQNLVDMIDILKGDTK